MMIFSILLVPLVVLLLLGAVFTVGATDIMNSPDDPLVDQSISETDHCCPAELFMLP